MLIVEAKGLTFEPREKTIINIEALKVYEGDHIGLIGANGSGKTTLMKLLVGVLEPTSGSVMRKGSIKYIPQLEIASEKIYDGEMRKQFKVPKEVSIGCMSGGERTRLKLAEGLSETSHLIALDEPTSHMDRVGIEILENKLHVVGNTILLISHDRELLDSVCNKIWELKEGKIKEYIGNYSEYCYQKEKEEVYQLKQYDNYQATKETLQKAKEEKERKARKITKKNKKMSPSDKRSKPLAAGTKSANTRAKNIYKAAKCIESRINQLEKIEKPKKDKVIDFSIPYQLQLKSKYAIIGRNLNKAYDDKVILQDAKFDLVTNSKTALIGENGVGKTTLMNLILQNKEGIIRNERIQIGYFDQLLEKLDLERTVLENVQKDSHYKESKIRVFLGQMLFDNNAIRKKVEVLSGGERVRVALCKLFVSSYNVLILDEPTNFLDIESLEVLEKAMINYPGTILFTSHDRAFVERAADTILQIANKRIEDIT